MSNQTPARRNNLVFIFFGLAILAGLCIVATAGVIIVGFLLNPGASTPVTNLPPTATPRPTFTPLPTASPTATPLPSFTPTATPTTAPTDTPVPSPTPSATSTIAPTNTVIPSATPVPPTATPLPPSPTPTPAYQFTVAEQAQFDTSHPNFDIYVAIVDSNNTPQQGYRLLGTHSSGITVDSPPSAGDWTENSGAMHYKGGNLKYQVPNSPTGAWTLQLVDEANTPVAAPLTYNFDAANPTWYFVILQKQ